MIPIENLVHNLISSGIPVNYTVHFFPRPGPVVWADAVQISLNMTTPNRHNRTYLVKIALENNGDINKIISKTSFNQILEFVDRIKNDIWDN